MNAGVVARARALIGVRFRPQGRSAAQGLDCIGLAALAADYPVEKVRRDYRMHGFGSARMETEIGDAGLARIAPGEAAAGDLLVVEAGPGQLHVVVLTPDGYVHADAGLRRVVEVPGAMAWPVRSAWRVGEG